MIHGGHYLHGNQEYRAGHGYKAHQSSDGAADDSQTPSAWFSAARLRPSSWRLYLIALPGLGATAGRQNSMPPAVNSYFVDSDLVSKQAREQQAAQTATAQHAASDQQASEPVLVAAIVLVVVLVFFSLFGPAAKQAREQQAAQTATAQQTASDQEASESMLVASALPVFFQ